MRGALFTEDAQYMVPTTDTPDAQPPYDNMFIDDDITRLRGRVTRLKSRHAHREYPASRTRHMVNNVRVIEASDKSIKDHEHVYRTMLRESLNAEDSDLPRRSGARKGILDAAIGSLKRELGDKRYQRLTAALSLFIGVEAAVVMRDVVNISDEDAREIKVWGANVILQAMLLEASHPVSSARSSKPETRMGKARRKRVA